MAPKKKHARKAHGRKPAKPTRRAQPPRRVAPKSKAKKQTAKKTKAKKQTHKRDKATGQFVSRKKSQEREVTNRAREVMGPELLTREYTDEVQKQASNGFVESRHFNSANALLGYLEGRPGVKGLVTVWQQLSEGGPSSRWSPAHRKEVLERLEATPPALDKKAEGSDEGGPSYDAWLERMMEALEWADDGGVLTEVEVENDSGVETA